MRSPVGGGSGSDNAGGEAGSGSSRSRRREKRRRAGEHLSELIEDIYSDEITGELQVAEVGPKPGQEEEEEEYGEDMEGPGEKEGN